MKCEPCSAIVVAKRGARGHEGLVESGPKTGYRPFAQAGVTISHYTCRNCGTKWAYEDDKNDNHCGWDTE